MKNKVENQELTNKFDYRELMERVEYLRKKASNDQLRIYHIRILNLRRALPEQYKDYRNLLKNIAIKWQTQKKGVFFMDSEFRKVNSNNINNLLRNQHSVLKSARNLKIIGIALTALGICVFAIFLAALVSPSMPFALPLLNAIGFAGWVTIALSSFGVAPILAGLGIGSISHANDEYKFYETNEKLNETIDSFEKDVELLNKVNKNDENQEDQQNNITSEESSNSTLYDNPQFSSN